MQVSHALRVGTAAWSIPGPLRADFAGTGTILDRYARRFDAVEINSSFYRPHRPATYSRWAAAVPAGFRFAVKMPRSITHERRLAGTEAEIDVFLDQVRHLGDALGPLLIQLPPSLDYDPAEAGAFLKHLRKTFDGPLVCEPRHPGWFGPQASQMLVDHRIARAAADPPPVPGADRPGGWDGLAYWRLHGSPRIYYSNYEPAQIDAMARTLLASGGIERWCIFDNTAEGLATGNALGLMERLASLTR